MPLKSIRAGDVKEVSVWDFDEDHQLFVAHRQAPIDQLPDLIRPHRITYFAIRWIIKGEIQAHVDHVPHELTTNSLMLANPQQISWFSAKGESHGGCSADCVH